MSCCQAGPWNWAALLGTPKRRRQLWRSTWAQSESRRVLGKMYRSFSRTPGNTLSLQGQVHVAVRKLLAAYPDEVGSITTTGHSLGGALASLCAFDLVCSFPLRLSHDVLASQWRVIYYAHMVYTTYRDELLSGADPNVPEHLNM